MMMGATTSSPPQPQQPTRQQPGFDTLPPELLSKILSYLDADFLARASGVCRLWNEMANSDVIWKRLCATRFPLLRHQPLDLHPRADYARLTPTLTVKEMKGILARRHVRIPRGAVEKSELMQLVEDTKPAGGPRGAWTGKWKSTYIVAELDLGRTRLTVQEVASMEWLFEFATTHTWHPAQQASLPHPTIAKFQPDGLYVNPALNAEGYRWHLTPEGGVQVETSPPHRVTRTRDGGWVLSNGYFTYRSMHEGRPC